MEKTFIVIVVMTQAQFGKSQVLTSMCGWSMDGEWMECEWSRNGV